MNELSDILRVLELKDIDGLCEIWIYTIVCELLMQGSLCSKSASKPHH